MGRERELAPALKADLAPDATERTILASAKGGWRKFGLSAPDTTA